MGERDRYSNEVQPVKLKNGSHLELSNNYDVIRAKFYLILNSTSLNESLIFSYGMKTKNVPKNQQLRLLHTQCKTPLGAHMKVVYLG